MFGRCWCCESFSSGPESQAKNKGFKACLLTLGYCFASMLKNPPFSLNFCKNEEGAIVPPATPTSLNFMLIFYFDRQFF